MYRRNIGFGDVEVDIQRVDLGQFGQNRTTSTAHEVSGIDKPSVDASREGGDYPCIAEIELCKIALRFGRKQTGLCRVALITPIFDICIGCGFLFIEFGETCEFRFGVLEQGFLVLNVAFGLLEHRKICVLLDEEK